MIYTDFAGLKYDKESINRINCKILKKVLDNRNAVWYYIKRCTSVCDDNPKRFFKKMKKRG